MSNTLYACAAILIIGLAIELSISVHLDIPLAIHTRAFQLVPDYRVRGGASWNF